MKIDFRTKEMRRMCGAIPQKDIDMMKQDMKNFISYDPGFFSEIEKIKPMPFDPSSYREGHNYINTKGNGRYVCDTGFYGNELIISDLHDLEPDEVSGRSITEIKPPVMLNDLVIRTTAYTRYEIDHPSILHRNYDVHMYDEKKEVFYWSRYESTQGYYKTLKSMPLIPFASDARSSDIWVPPSEELVISAAIPIRWVILMLTVGMWGQWEDMSFYDYPILLSYEKDEPYRLYKTFRKEHDINDDSHSLVAEALESSIGYQRYLIKLTEDRDKVSLISDKKPKTKKTGQSGEDGTIREEVKKRRPAIQLNKDIIIYTTDLKTAKSIKKRRLCDYRYSVRGHFRHYKNGRKVWIGSYDKNKDKPFRPHQYIN